MLHYLVTIQAVLPDERSKLSVWSKIYLLFEDPTPLNLLCRLDIEFLKCILSFFCLRQNYLCLEWDN